MASLTMTDIENESVHWKEAIDPKSGRTYFYDRRNRETQWRKPLCLASPTERQDMIDNENKQKSFFEEMEANVLKNLQKGLLTTEIMSQELDENNNEDDDSLTEMSSSLKSSNDFPRTRHTSSSEPPIPTSRMVRTISSMDDLMIAELQKNENAKKNKESEKSLSPNKMASTTESGEVDNNSLRTLSADIRAMASLNREISSGSGSGLSTDSFREQSESFSNSSTSPTSSTMPILQHRNSGSTIYVGTTMSAPDKDATIRCVCGVFRAHMVQAALNEVKDDEKMFTEYEIFNDAEFRVKKGVDGEGPALERSISKSEAIVPSLDVLHSFYRTIFNKSQMEPDCIIMSLIYVERLLKKTNGGIRLRYSNYKSVIFSSMVMASKVWDDLSMWNADFSQVCSSFNLNRINELELAMLDALKYDVKVLASEYAKYYFLLRSMLMKSGLGGDHVETMSPLSIDGAKQLEALSEEFQEIATQEVAMSLRRRAVSCSDMGEGKGKGGKGKGGGC